MDLKFLDQDQEQDFYLPLFNCRHIHKTQQSIQRSMGDHNGFVCGLHTSLTPSQDIHESGLPSTSHPHEGSELLWPESPTDALQQLQLLFPALTSDSIGTISLLRRQIHVVAAVRHTGQAGSIISY